MRVRLPESFSLRSDTSIVQCKAYSSMWIVNKGSSQFSFRRMKDRTRAKQSRFVVENACSAMV